MKGKDMNEDNEKLVYTRQWRYEVWENIKGIVGQLKKITDEVENLIDKMKEIDEGIEE